MENKEKFEQIIHENLYEIYPESFTRNEVLFLMQAAYSLDRVPGSYVEEAAEKWADSNNPVYRGADTWTNVKNSFIAGWQLSQNGDSGKWQLCPKCNGMGTVHNPYAYSTSSALTIPCDVCNGAKILPTPQTKIEKK